MRVDQDHRTVRELAQPRSVDEALALKAAAGGHATFVAGGTDVGVQLRRHVVHPEILISLDRIAELQRLELHGRTIVIGAAVTHRAIERSSLFSGAYSALQEACATVGSIQTRNVGTIGGNLANASPAADTAPVLLALEAEVVLAGPDVWRTVPLKRFFLEYRRTELHSDELIVQVQLPVAGERSGSAFAKLGRRRAMEISVGCVGAAVELDEDGVCLRAGVGVGAVASTPLRVAAAEQALVGTRLQDDDLKAAADAVRSAAAPVDDHRASASYRDRVLGPLVRRAIATATGRAVTEPTR